MDDIVEITPEQSFKLTVLSLFNNDVTAGKVALEFVGTSKLNYQLLSDQLPNASGETSALARAIKAVALATDALEIINASIS